MGNDGLLGAVPTFFVVPWEVCLRVTMKGGGVTRYNRYVKGFMSEVEKTTQQQDRYVICDVASLVGNKLGFCVSD